MAYRINGFEQIKAFYSWVFNNPDKIRPTHISLYLFLINQNNRSNWVEWFKCPYDLAMQGACIGNKGTYYKCLDELKNWGIIDYKKGINGFKAPLIKLTVMYDSEPLTVPLCEPLTVPQTVPLPVHIYKLITDNLKSITNNFDIFSNFVNSLDDIKIDKDDIKNIYNLYPSKCIVKGSSTGKTREKNLKQIETALKKYTFSELSLIIERYIQECKKSQTYMKNFTTFLNNIPDYSEEQGKEKLCKWENTFGEKKKGTLEQYNQQVKMLGEENIFNFELCN